MKFLISFAQIFLFLIVSSLFATAQTAVQPQGEGSEASPYLISNWQELYWVSQNASSWSSHFLQTQSIDFADSDPSIETWNSGKGWMPIGNFTVKFTGYYDGNEKTVKNIYCNTNDSYIGLFGNVKYCTVIDLGLVDLNITGGSSVGSIAGYSNYSKIRRCFSYGTVTSPRFGAGGLVGYSSRDSITDSYARVDVINGSDYQSGGFVGSCTSSVIHRCYSTGTVCETNGLNGFHGKAYGGYLSFDANYWNIETSLLATSPIDIVTGLSDAEMKNQVSFSGWDFTGVWSIDPNINNGYPYLFSPVNEAVKLSISPQGILDNTIPCVAYCLFGTDEQVLESGFIAGTEPMVSLVEGSYAVKQTLGAMSESARFDGNIQGLSAGTNYFYCAYAVTASDTVYSQIHQIRTLDIPAAIPAGDGTADSPYLISNWKELMWFNQIPGSWDKYFLQTADIDLADAQPSIDTWDGGNGWSPIGTVSLRFTGKYDGNGKVIKHLFSKRVGYDYKGFFGYIDAAEVCRLGIVDATIIGNDYTGVLSARSQNSKIYQCFSSGLVSGNMKCGGLIGDTYIDTIADCFSRVRVRSSSSNSGGLIGTLYHCQLHRTYSVGKVEKISGKNGLIGGSISNTDVLSNYWNIETTLQTGTYLDGIIGLTDDEMLDKDNYSNWDFENVWNISPDYNNGYPYLTPIESEPVRVAAKVRYSSSNEVSVFGRIFLAANAEVLDYGIVLGDSELVSLTDGAFSQKKEYGPAAASVSFTGSIDALQPATSYYCRAYAVTDTDTLYSDLQQAETDELPSRIPAGNGTDADPYLISNWQELLWLSLHSVVWDKYFMQTADIDLADAVPAIESWNSGCGWSPIGHNDWVFKGTYDGNSKIISGLYANDPPLGNASLFGYLAKGAAVKSLGVIDADITGRSNVAVLVGHNYGIISKCFVSGSVAGRSYTGGLVGQNGSLYVTPEASVSDCYSLADVYCLPGTVDNLAGFVGANYATVERCYSTGMVGYADEADPVDKGFVGYGARGLAGNYWNMTTSRQTSTDVYSEDMAAGLTNEQMQMQESFQNWDFVDVWKIAPDVNDGFPYLVPLPDPKDKITLLAYNPESDGLVFSGILEAGSSPAEYGILVNDTETVSLPVDNIEKTELGTATGVKTFQSVIENLPTDKLLYFSLYATDGTDTVYSDVVQVQLHSLPSKIPEGSGTEENPYLISNWHELSWLSQSPDAWDKHYLQTADVDMDDAQPAISEWNGGKGWSPVGSIEKPFAGSYDGGSKMVSGIYISATDEQYKGFFGRIGSSGTVENLALARVDISAKGKTGALVGSNAGNIYRCSAWGSVKASENVGGLVGQNMMGTVAESYSRVQVTAMAADKYASAGGFIGYTYKGEVTHCYSAGRMVFSQGSAPDDKGFVGIVVEVGGFVVSGNFWNTTTSLQASTGGAFATGIETAEMQQAGVFLAKGWDFDGESANGTEEIWSIDPAYNLGFPYHASINPDKPFLKLTPGETTGTSIAFSLLAIAGSRQLDELGVLVDTAVITSFDENTEAAKITYGTSTATATVIDTLKSLSIDKAYYILPYAVTGADTVLGQQKLVRTQTLPVTKPKGTGTPIDPYLISNWQELAWLSLSPDYWGMYFLQTADIDMRDADPAINTWESGLGWSPIGTQQMPFTGSYNGGGKLISALRSNRPSDSYIGMFGYLASGASVASLGVVNSDFVGNSNVGALAGYCAGSVEECFVTGFVTGKALVGGFAGSVDGGSSVTNAFSKFFVNRSSGENSAIGGFAGRLGSGSISDCYSTGLVSYQTAADPSDKGFVGDLDLSATNTLSHNYWDTETSAQLTSGESLALAQAKGMSSEEMKQLSNFIGWEYGTVWLIGDEYNNGYPFLRAIDFSSDFLKKTELSACGNSAFTSSIEVDAEFISLDGGTVHSHGFLISKASSFDLETEYLDKIELGNRSETGTFTARFDNLVSSNVYYCRAYAVNAQGASYSPIVQVTTLDVMLAVPEGSGDSEGDPYIIKTLGNLYWLSDQSNTYGNSFEGKYFRQVKDIDASSTQRWLSGKGWPAIGANGQVFNGVYEGDGHFISRLWMESLTSFDLDTLALFREVGTLGEIRNLNMEQAEISSFGTVGCLAGVNRGAIVNCSVDGVLTSRTCLGGLVGINFGDIAHSTSYCTINVVNPGQGMLFADVMAGGFVGNNSGTVTQSKFDGVIAVSSHFYGGFVGLNSGAVEQCVALGSVGDNQDYDGAGFVCRNSGTVSDSYSFVSTAVASFVLVNTGTVANCYSTGAPRWEGFGSGGIMTANFWDIETSAYTGTSDAATGLPTAEMKKASNFINAGWDFYGETTNGTDDIWAMNPRFNNGYPFLKWEAPALTFIGGTVYYDRDKNGEHNEGDVPIGGLTVELLPSGTITGTANDGSYAFYAEPGDYTVKIHTNEPYSQGTDPLEYPVTLKLLQDSTLPAVGLLGEDVYAFESTLATVWTRCGRTVPLWVVAENKSNIPADITLAVKLDENVTVENQSVQPDSVSDEGIRYFGMANMQAYESRMLRIDVSTPVAFTDSIGYSSIIYHDGVAKDTTEIKSLVRCSYDPNDVQVFPMGIQPEGSVPMGQELTYMIRFQNTGNDTAFMVDVLDTLATTIDPTSFTFVGASHPLRYFVNPDGSMRFLFEDINLLDSTSNEPESHGFILFKVKPKADIVSGDQASLKASIYFDYNPPVVTNTVISTFTEADETVTQIFEIKEGWNFISLYVEPEDSKLEEALSACLSSIEEVKTLDKFYNSTYGQAFNSLKEINGGGVYLIKASGDGECSVSGRPVFTPFEYSLGKGWNMIGCPVDATPDFSKILEGTTTEKLINFDAIWLPDATDNPVVKFEPGKGYFIYTGAGGSVHWSE